ncbi:MAG: hypothetical protein II915_02325, partial [Eubacterium sp.]|nr:hypothetical protein [Eubacterium sp.]
KKDVDTFDVMEDKRIQCFVGSDSAYNNLKLIKHNPVKKILTIKDREYIFSDLENVIPVYLQDAIWNMIITRWKVYEDLQNM